MKYYSQDNKQQETPSLIPRPQHDVCCAGNLGIRLGEALEDFMLVWMLNIPSPSSLLLLSPPPPFSSLTHSLLQRKLVEQWKKLSDKTRQQCAHMYLHAAQQWRFCGATLFLAEVHDGVYI